MFVALIAPGCATSAGPESTTPTTTATSASSTTNSPPTTPVSTSPRTSLTSGTPPLSAANGTDVKSCSNADCEIVITGEVTIPMARKFDCTTFIMRHAAPHKVSFSVDCAETGVVNGYVLGKGTIRLANSVAIEIDRNDSAGAVLHFLPKTDDPGRNKASGEFGASIG